MSQETKTDTNHQKGWQEALRSRVIHDFYGTGFSKIAMEVFRYQFKYNPVYRQFVQLLHREPEQCIDLGHIPFIPVSLFKSHPLVSGSRMESSPLVFKSSGTTGSVPSVHEIQDPSLYQQSFMRGFQRVFGPPADYHIFALLPTYLERGHSSLVYMVNKLMEASVSDQGGFYLDDHNALFQALVRSQQSDRKTMLIGVTFALLDFIPALKHKLPDLMLVETGGMKGRGTELVREELYSALKQGYGVRAICSEYGMTELCSQGWSLDQGLYHPPPWMKVLIRDLNDPFHLLEPGKRGGVNIIDLANLNSCSFIASDDLGLVHPDGSFEILGRLDGSEMRGCNLMVI
jgi:phenylacetate-coenzyme A ligase PaaK-like adenylate-forming protein